MISPELLRRYACFAAVPDQTLATVAMMAEETTAGAGTRLFEERDPADVLSIIVDGEVDVQQKLENCEVRTVDTLIPGDILGWPAMVEPYRMTTSAICRTPTRLIRIDAPRLRQLCEQEPGLGYRLLSQIAVCLSERLEAARIQLATVA